MDSSKDAVRCLILMHGSLMSHHKAYIIGSGFFGDRAFYSLQSLFQTASITMVDKRFSQLKKIIADGGQAVVMDAVSFLTASKENLAPDDWIIPAVPIHLAYEWFRQELKPTSECRTLPVPEALETMLPNTIKGLDGQLYASNADFICPDDCPEPDDYCTVTGEPRPQVLSNTLSSLKLPGFYSTCIVSSQLAPGVGGFQWSVLPRTLKEIKAHPGKILVGTACKCHCVMHAFLYRPFLSS